MNSKHYIVATFFLLPLYGCDDGKPIVNRTSAYPSPDGAYVATLEEVDNGLGFGQGALYEEVHVTRQGDSIGEHGNPGRSVVFYAESTYKTEPAVNVAWVNSRKLQVKYAPEQHPGRALGRLGEISIEVVEQVP